MRVLITGANGFVGKNLQLHLAEREDVQVICFTRENGRDQLPALLKDVDCVFHLAGVNRPQDQGEFASENADLTAALATAWLAEIERSERKLPLIYTSSTQAAQDNAYGFSKKAAEDTLFELQRARGLPAHVFRLPNVFGKWCRPNYNSVVATFCHNIARDLPIILDDPAALVTLVYVDDVVERFIQLMDGAEAACDPDGFSVVTPQYTTTVGELAERIKSFKDSRNTLMSERVGIGFMRALYATFISYLPVEAFSYSVPMYEDYRGVFAEMLKTQDCGQFSYFTVHPGITRGGHYHHTKTEKFLVVRGVARFKFRNMQTRETHEIVTSSEKAEIVETIPGWTHDITNIGQDEMVVMLWANEVFDRNKPDTFACPL